MAYNASQRAFRLYQPEAATLAALEALHEEQLSEIMLRAVQRAFERMTMESVCSNCGRPFDPEALENAPDQPETDETGMRNFRLSPETLRFFEAIKSISDETGSGTVRQLLANQWAYSTAIRLPCTCGTPWPWQNRSGFQAARDGLQQYLDGIAAADRTHAEHEGEANGTA